MKLAEVEKFIKECLEKEVLIPDNLQFHIDDYNDIVPEHMRNVPNLEYNVRFDDYHKKIFILPPLV